MLYAVPLFIYERIVIAKIARQIDDTFTRLIQRGDYFFGRAVREGGKYHIAVGSDAFFCGLQRGQLQPAQRSEKRIYILPSIVL
ncbi:hypothetical protein SDC9_118012 [bioreactor metagenome]|uniref:Uncharacterized protein n=1 Tax=bioreactor metagenome TaxID=1076179 RepID=A0A645C0A8_9ZZZZ